MLTSIEYSQRLGFKDQILVVTPISMKLNNQNNEKRAVIPFFSLRSIFFQLILEVVDCQIVKLGKKAGLAEAHSR